MSERKQRSDKGKSRKWYRQSWRKQKKLGRDLRNTQIDICKFEIIEAEKIGDTAAIELLQIELDRLLKIVEATKQSRKPRKRKMLGLLQDEEIQRLEYKLERKERRKKLKSSVDYHTTTRNERKQEARRKALPHSRTCRNCNCVKLETAKWVVNNSAGVICKSCWTKILNICKANNVNCEGFCNYNALGTINFELKCSNFVEVCNCLQCMMRRYLLVVNAEPRIIKIGK